MVTSIWWMIIGLFAKSTIGLGTVNVRGRSLVPYPPTRINAFMVASNLASLVDQGLLCRSSRGLKLGHFGVRAVEAFLSAAHSACWRL